MASVGLTGNYKPLAPGKIRMDTSKAMAIMGFPSSQAFEHTSMEEIEKAFMIKVHMLEIQQASTNNPKSRSSNKMEIRKLNEALQFLIRKRRRLTGRGMQENWHLLSLRSNKARGVISTIQCSNGLALAVKAEQVDDQLGKEAMEEFIAEQESKKREQSRAARELAAELTGSKKSAKDHSGVKDVGISSSISIAKQLSKSTISDNKPKREGQIPIQPKPVKRTLGPSSQPLTRLSTKHPVQGSKIRRSHPLLKKRKTELNLLQKMEDVGINRKKTSSASGLSDFEDDQKSCTHSLKRPSSVSGVSRSRPTLPAGSLSSRLASLAIDPLKRPKSFPSDDMILQSDEPVFSD